MFERITRRNLLAAAALFAAACVPALPVRGAIARENFLSDDEQHFVNQAWGLNAIEIALSKGVEHQAANVDVKAFGERMAAYHTIFNDELKTLATQYRGSVPDRLDDEARRVFERLAGLSGTEFDREYMRTVIATLRQAIGLFDRQSKDVAETPLDRWAGTVVPKLQHQLAAAERIGQEVGAPADDGAVTASHKEPGNSR